MWALRRAGIGLALIVVAMAGCGGDEGQTAGSTAADAGAAPTTEPSDNSLTAATGDDEGFCAEVEAAGEELQSFAHGPDFTDVDDAANALRQSRDTLQSIEPPAEIADEWSTVISYFDAAVTSFDDLDFSDPVKLEQQLEELTTLLEQGSADLEEAGTRIDAYLKDECGIVLD